MKLKILVALILPVVLFQNACTKREPVAPVSPTGPVGIKPPEEPMLNLAWMAATQIQLGLQQAGQPMMLRMLPLDNSAGIPAGAADYLQAVLETRLRVFGIQMPGDASVQLQGSVYWLRNQLVYGFKLRKGEQILLTDSASIPRDERLENSIAQFGAPVEHKHVHVEPAIPTPVAQLKEAPLDVGQYCAGSSDPCGIALLYPDRMEILNWKTLAVRVKAIPAAFLNAVRSRAPSGKIVRTDSGYILLSNNFSGPLHFDSEFNGPVPGVADPRMPSALPGNNTYALGDGRFTDFELLPDGGVAVVEPNHRLSAALAGSLITAANPAGDALAARWPQVYTSAPVLPGQADLVQKYTYRDGVLAFDSSRPAVGSIVDLSVTDLNRDGAQELLVTVQKPEGVFIEVWEAF